MSELLNRLQAALGDRYAIERELGGGGMSRVFLAEERALRRRVVVKVLPPERRPPNCVEASSTSGWETGAQRRSTKPLLSLCGPERGLPVVTRTAAFILRTMLAGVVAAAPAAPAGAIPAFARRYKTTCALCHDPVPKLNAYGQQFQANGYQIGDSDTTDVTSVGDPLLWLQRTLPLAVRMDAYIRTLGGERTGSDFSTPTVMKLLSGGSITPTVSYYFYLLLAENGVTGPVEDAWLAFRHPAGIPLEITVGQFQLADPVWDRELRLPFEDYEILQRQVGSSAADLTYNRGITLAIRPTGGTAVYGEMVNGNGIGEAVGGTFDSDPAKTGVVWITQEIGPVKVAGVGYYGAQRVTPTGGGNSIRNRTRMLGPAVSLSLGQFEVSGQYLWRDDTDPGFTGTASLVRTNGGFLEALWWPLGHGNRVTVTGLYNRIGSDDAAARYETTTLNLSYLAARNLRLALEGTYDHLTRHARAAAGFVTAF